MVEVPKMLTLKSSFKLTIKAVVLAASTLLSGINIHCLEQSKPAANTTSGWFSSISSYLWASKQAISTPAPAPTKPESGCLADQLQTATRNLHFYYQSTPEDLDLSTTERTTKITEFADQIDQLISDKALNLQNQSKEFYWSFSFPTQELLELNKIETLKKYVLKAKITDQINQLVGANFAFIGILNSQLPKLIEINKTQIATSAVEFEINARCCLWRYLIEHKNNSLVEPGTVIEDCGNKKLFLIETLKSNILNAIKFAVDRSDHRNLTDTRAIALKLDCSPAAIAYIDGLIILRDQKKLQAHNQEVQRIFDHIIQVLKRRQEGSSPVSGGTELMNRALGILRTEGYSFKDEIIAEVIVKLRKQLTAPISCSPSVKLTTGEASDDSCDEKTDCDSASAASPSYQSKSSESVTLSPIVDHPTCGSPTEFVLDATTAVKETMPTVPAPVKPSTCAKRYTPAAFTYIIASKKYTGGGISVPTDKGLSKL